MKIPLARLALLVALLISTGRVIAAEPAGMDVPSPDEPQRGPMVPPQPVKAVQPEYPLNMRAAGLEARVLLQFVVDKEGRVRDPHVVRSNNPWFERPAIDAILKWKFAPATVGGRVVFTRVQQEITFQLHGRGQDLWQVSKMKSHDQLPESLRWDKPPIPVHTNYPIYPYAAVQAKESGKVVLRYIVDPDGNITEAEALESASPEFAGAALAAIDAWRFKPATRNGSACHAVLQHTWEFSPNGSNRDTVPISDGARTVLRELAKKNPAVSSAAELDERVQPLSRRPPIYPSTLRKAGEQGSAEIEFYIDKNGDAQLPRILSASQPQFGFAASQAVASWRFQPPRKDGKAVICRAQIRVAFSLKDEDPKNNKAGE